MGKFFVVVYGLFFIIMVVESYFAEMPYKAIYAFGALVFIEFMITEIQSMRIDALEKELKELKE